MMDVFILSCDEPQLDKCLLAVHGQVIPFEKVIHVANVVPHAKALMQALNQITGEWVMMLAGDMVIKNLATVMAYKYLEEFQGEKVGMIYFNLYDPFIGTSINGCHVANVEALHKAAHKDVLRDDVVMADSMRSQGWEIKKAPMGAIIGTHMEDPNDFQIFKRYFVCKVKGQTGYLPRLRNMLQRTGDPRYEMAIAAYRFGAGKKYPGSKNIEYETKMYEEFKRECAYHFSR